jgi:glutamate carboxypeptidase
VRLLRHGTAGSAVVAEFWGQTRRERPILLLGHLDTVWDVGTLADMPFRVRGGRAYGPGIFDMKSGLVCGLWAVQALEALKITPPGPVSFFLNADEEVSSLAFRKELLAEARRARAVLVLEPAAARGALKTARKGVGEFMVTVRGRSAHAGVNPSVGVNAISELARQILCIEKLARPRRGLTLNVDVIQGGTRSNVIPELASASVDARLPTERDREEIEQKMRALRPIHPEAKLEVSGGINRPPMERKMAIALFRKAHALGLQMGLELEEASTGGGSDGNFTAALGIPTLDGLGGTGDGAHARHEHVIIRELPQRAALLAALIASI